MNVFCFPLIAFETVSSILILQLQAYVICKKHVLNSF